MSPIALLLIVCRLLPTGTATVGESSVAAPLNIEGIAESGVVVGCSFVATTRDLAPDRPQPTLDLAIQPDAPIRRLRLSGFRIDAEFDRRDRLLRFASPSSDSEIAPLRDGAESDTLLVIAAADRRITAVADAEFPEASEQRWQLTRGERGTSLSLELRFVAAIGGPIVGCVTVTNVEGAPDLVTLVADLRGTTTEDRPTLESISHLAPPPALRLRTAPDPESATGSFRRTCESPVAGRPLDAFSSEGTPTTWASEASAIPAALVISNPTDEAKIAAVALATWSPSLRSGAIVVDPTFSEELGSVATGLVVPVPPLTTRRFVATPLGERPAPRIEVVCLRPGPSPEETEVLTLDSVDPRLENEALSTWSREGIVIVHHPGAGSLEPIPPALAQHLAPTIVPHRAVSRSIAPKGPLERFTKLASNLEWVLALPQQPVDSRDWLVCIEAGFLATPLQPRIVDGMPAARGFMVNLVPGGLLVTTGVGANERAALVERLLDRAMRIDALRRSGAAQRAVRAERPITGLFAGLSNLQRTRSEDLTPGDPVSLMRAAASSPPDARRRLRTLRAPAPDGRGPGEMLTEDVLEYTGTFNFAIDLPSPFVDPLLVVVRRIDDGSDFQVSYEGRALDRLASRRADDGQWCEEIHLLPRDRCEGQVRIQLSCGSTDGRAQLARIGFFSSSAGSGRGLGYLAPQGVIPVPDAVRFAIGGSGDWIVRGGKILVNALELSAGSKVEYALKDTEDPRWFTASVLARGGDAPLQFVVEIDGAERARYFVDPEAKEPLDLRLEISRPRTVTLGCPTAAEGAALWVLDPRLR